MGVCSNDTRVIINGRTCLGNGEGAFLEERRFVNQGGWLYLSLYCLFYFYFRSFTRISIVHSAIRLRQWVRACRDTE